MALIKLEGTQQGAYIKYPCHECSKTAVIKAYGEKKNLWYRGGRVCLDIFMVKIAFESSGEKKNGKSGTLIKSVMGKQSRSFRYLMRILNNV